MKVDLKKFLKQDQKENIVDVPNFKVKDKVLSYNDNFIQISNISRVSISPVEPIPYPKYPIVFILIGLIMLETRNTLFMVLGLAAISFAIYIYYDTYKQNETRGTYLQIQLNSGREVWFVSKQDTFLNEIMDVLKRIINEDLNNAYVDFANSIVNFGDNSNFSNVNVTKE